MADPKKNTYLQLQQARKEIQELRQQLEIMKGFTLQQALDIARIALNLEFSFGPKNNARFKERFISTFLAYARMCVDDSKDDPSIEYTWAKLDRLLEVACGKDEPPHEVRYALENLYFRDQLTKVGSDG